jgi:protein phosphatase
MSKNSIMTKLGIDTYVKEENKMAAFEIMGRFAVPPNWMIYLPPTMSPCETSSIDDMLEHPYEAFSYFEEYGVEQVVCEEKHMGSRAIVIICKDREVAKTRFYANDNKKGICYSRTGKYFFKDSKFEDDLIERFENILTKNDFWNSFDTDWVCFDCEIMPWSKKAKALIKEQYAPVGTAGMVALDETVNLLEKVLNREFLELKVEDSSSDNEVDIYNLYEKFKVKKDCISSYVDVYRQYCWKVDTIDDLKIAPFHILATENKVYSSKDHIWHMEMIRKYFDGDKIFVKTEYKVVNLNSKENIEEAVNWWVKLTNSGGEGMVVKPIEFLTMREDEVIQPAIKCRGKEYLRIIYGPEYTMNDKIKKLKKRSLRKKRSFAIKEFALGIEALERFVDREPLYRIHECVFNILAMETEPVDPRL